MELLLSIVNLRKLSRFPFGMRRQDCKTSGRGQRTLEERLEDREKYEEKRNSWKKRITITMMSVVTSRKSEWT